jgi:hypothetical protein
LSQVTRARLARAFDRQRQKNLGAAARLIFLKLDGAAETYAPQATVESGWHAYFSEESGAAHFEVADDTAEFRDKKNLSSHLVVVSSAVPALNNVVHTMLRGGHAPLAARPYWNIPAEPAGEVYTP